MSRNVEEGCQLYEKLFTKNIELAFGQAQKEVDDLHQRTSEDIETARLNGKQIGGMYNEYS